MATDLAEYFERKGQASGRFMPSGESVAGRSCVTCKRRTMSFPDACNDGWPLGNPEWVDRGSSCANYLEDRARRLDPVTL